jgi:hypothetical protein
MKTPHDAWPWWLTLILSPLALAWWLRKPANIALALLLFVCVFTVARRIAGPPRGMAPLQHECCGRDDLNLTASWKVAFGGGTLTERQKFYHVAIAEHAGLQALTSLFPILLLATIRFVDTIPQMVLDAQ